MKKIFSILVVCCTAFAFASDRPIFEEADDNETRIYYAPIPFAAQEPIFEEDDEVTTQEKLYEIAGECDECGEDSCDCDAYIADCDQCGEDDCDCPANTLAACDECGQDDCDCCFVDEDEAEETVRYLKQTICGGPMGDSRDELYKGYSINTWNRYKSNFGMEKIVVRFPQKPAVSQSSSLFTAYAYDHAVMYSFAGYFPPLGHIDPIRWFDELLYNLSAYPYNLISHAIFQASNGDWLMDYVAHDYVQNLVIKARAVVTPFNGYILQCVKPNGTRDHFNYFLDNFWLRCECED